MPHPHPPHPVRDRDHEHDVKGLRLALGSILSPVCLQPTLSVTLRRSTYNLMHDICTCVCMRYVETHTLLTRIRLVLWHRLARALRAGPRPSLSLSPLPAISRAWTRIRAARAIASAYTRAGTRGGGQCAADADRLWAERRGKKARRWHAAPELRVLCVLSPIIALVPTIPVSAGNATPDAAFRAGAAIDSDDEQRAYTHARADAAGAEGHQKGRRRAFEDDGRGEGEEGLHCNPSE